jgi:hypothetical protein
MNVDVLAAIDEYYKLKLKYDRAKENELKKYISDEELDKIQKREKFSRFKPKCVNCNKPGGTAFSNKNRILQAACKASPPCKLNIKIQLGSYDKKLNVIEEYSDYKSEDQTNIIKTKLNLLYNYVTESETIQKFEELKNNFFEMNKILNSLVIDYLLIIDNPTRNQNLNDGIISLYQSVQELKNIDKEYNKDTKPEYIRDAIELYINKIHPNAERNRNLKYSYNSIEFDDDVSVLIQKPYTLEQIEINFGETPAIISNIR